MLSYDGSASSLITLMPRASFPPTHVIYEMEYTGSIKFTAEGMVGIPPSKRVRPLLVATKYGMLSYLNTTLIRYNRIFMHGLASGVDSICFDRVEAWAPGLVSILSRRRPWFLSHFGDSSCLYFAHDTGRCYDFLGHILNLRASSNFCHLGLRFDGGYRSRNRLTHLPQISTLE